MALSSNSKAAIRAHALLDDLIDDIAVDGARRDRGARVVGGGQGQHTQSSKRLHVPALTVARVPFAALGCVEMCCCFSASFAALPREAPMPGRKRIPRTRRDRRPVRATIFAVRLARKSASLPPFPRRCSAAAPTL